LACAKYIPNIFFLDKKYLTRSRRSIYLT